MAASRVVYQARQEMSRGKAAVVTAAVTLDFETPANKVLRRSTAVAEEVFIVSCHLEARLRASHYDFALDSTKWIGRSLLTTDTARWQWYATPKTGGWHVLVLELRPIVRLRPVDEGSASPGSSQTVTDTADLVSYETSVHVSVPWSQRPQEWMTVAAKNLGLAEGLVRALTALLVALAALFTAWRVLRRRSVRPRAALPEDGDGPSPT